MKFAIGIISVIILAINCQAQNYQADFLTHIQKRDTVKMFQTLSLWEQKSPRDPELFISYFNYYVIRSAETVLALTTEKPAGESLVMTDSLGAVAGYVGSQIRHNEYFLQKGINKIDEGIKLYPDRLDMIFGKIHVLGRAEKWNDFTKAIIKAVDYSKENDNQWQWTNNERISDGETFFLSSLQDYQLILYETNVDSLLQNMKEIADEILKFYPNHVESMSNIAIAYIIEREYDMAIGYLQRAEKIRPEDTVVLSNIAYAYSLKKDKENAIEYYEKIMKSGDKEAVEFAKRQINELKK